MRGFFGAAKTREFDDFDRPVGKAVAERLKVLFAKERGWAQHGNLFAARDGAKSSAQRDFGFAKTDVAADQTIHRSTRFHVVEHGDDGGGLIGRFFEAKTVGKGFVIVRAKLKRVALSRGAARVQSEQFGGGIVRLQSGAALGFFPLLRAEVVQRGTFWVAARVARNNVLLRNGDV